MCCLQKPALDSHSTIDSRTNTTLICLDTNKCIPAIKSLANGDICFNRYNFTKGINILFELTRQFEKF